MDEPLSALDEKTRTDMQNLILDIHKQTHNTIIMITHSKEEAEKAAEILGEAMRNAAQLSVPLKVDVNMGENWYVAKG